MLMGSIVHFILHRGKKLSRGFRRGIVINCRSIDVGHLLIKITLAGPDVPDTLKKFPEITSGPAFQPFVVKSKTFADILVQSFCRPNAELGPPLGFYAVANRYDDIKVVVINLINLAVSGSCCNFCNNCLRS